MDKDYDHEGVQEGGGKKISPLSLFRQEKSKPLTKFIINFAAYDKRWPDFYFYDPKKGCKASFKVLELTLDVW